MADQQRAEHTVTAHDMLTAWFLREWYEDWDLPAAKIAASDLLELLCALPVEQRMEAMDMVAREAVIDGWNEEAWVERGADEGLSDSAANPQVTAPRARAARRRWSAQDAALAYGTIDEIEQALFGDLRQRSRDGLVLEIERLRRHEKEFAEIIVRCSIAAGGADPVVAAEGLTGPQVMLLGSDLAEHLEVNDPCPSCGGVWFHEHACTHDDSEPVQ